MKDYQELDFYNNDAIRPYDLDETIRRQLRILDGLDAFTRKHSENVGNLVCRICDRLKLDPGFTKYAAICGYIHDIGKTFIPPAVLQKNGKLTEEEFEIMKTHVTIGYEMCKKDPGLYPYLAGPLYHHEGLDGTGYPRGLQGDDIVYEGQIIRVADEFDAITSRRQYKTHIGVVDTLNILIENSKPTKNSKPLPGHLTKTVGKINKDILKVLIQLIIEDTEYEMYLRGEYIKYLKNEYSRYKDAYKYYEKSMKARNEDKKEYFKIYAEGYLNYIEKFEDIPKYLENIVETINQKKESEKKLEEEYKKLKKLKV